MTAPGGKPTNTIVPRVLIYCKIHFSQMTFPDDLTKGGALRKERSAGRGKCNISPRSPGRWDDHMMIPLPQHEALRW